MSNKKYAQAVAGVITDTYGADVRVVSKPLNNGGTAYGVAIMDKNVEGVSPVIYTEQFCEEGMGAADAAEEVVELSRRTFIPNDMAENAGWFVSKEYILENVTVELINAAMNADMLKEYPHFMHLGLAAVYRVYFGKHGSYLVNDEQKTAAGITDEELMEAARRNTEEKGFESFTIGEMLGFHDDDMEIHVITNEDKLYGAAALLFPEIFAELADTIDDDLYILPSSIHEVLVMGRNGKEAIDLLNMVKSINADGDIMRRGDVLADSVYLYSRETATITVAA